MTPVDPITIYFAGPDSAQRNIVDLVRDTLDKVDITYTLNIDTQTTQMTISLPDEEDAPEWSRLHAIGQAIRDARLATISEDRVAAALGPAYTVTRPSTWHYQVRRKGKVVAQWWPSTSKTTIGATRKGPLCSDIRALVAVVRKYAP